MPFTSLLVATAEFSHVLSIVIVLSCFTVMFFFILRLIGQDLMDQNYYGATPVNYTPPEVSMAKVEIPVEASLMESTNNDSMECRLVSNCSKVMVRSYWGVSISTFHHVLRAPISWFKDSLLRGNLFGKDGCRIIGEKTPLENFHLKIPTSKVDLSPAPRNVYPLILCCFVDGKSSEVVVVIFVIHIRDEICRIPTQILNTYLKLADGQSIHLQPLFLQESDEDEGESLCVVCRVEPVTRVILPCKHACACQLCFKRLKNRCPMCRTWIQSYFLFKKEEFLFHEDKDTDRNVPQTWREWLQDFNHRFAMRMGLQENN